MIKIGRPRDFWSGLMFLALGAGFAWGGRGYGIGGAAEPGPGFLSFGLGLLLAALGLLGVLRGLRQVQGPDHGRDESAQRPVGAIAWRPLLGLCAAIGLFAALLPGLGLMLALPASVLAASAAGDEFRWREALGNAAVLTAGSWAVFIWGLGLSIPVWPTGLR